MDWLLIGSFWSGVAAWFYTWGTVIIGLGMVIFIHELGHFLVAKACGVKCEKFYVGFDVPITIPLGKLGKLRLPRTLWKKQWGETEYGIGILPLGGYVKMLGQDDNPYRQEQEYERARAAGQSAAGAGGAADTVTSAPAATVTDVEQPEDSRWDPRSYLAKSVPQRMAIISAGVIMNIILAFVLASIAYGFGVEYTASVIGHVAPGGAAWKHNIPVGAEITRIDDIVDPRFEKDLRRVTVLTRKGRTVELEYLDPDTQQTRQVTIAPEVGEDKLARLGITSSYELQLGKKPLAIPGSPAAEAGFEPGDRIVAVRVEGEAKPVPVKTFGQFQEILVRHPDKTLHLTLQKDEVPQDDSKRSTAKPDPAERTVMLKPMPIRDLGLVMKTGKISHVQPQSPAEQAGIRPGDEIVRITPMGSDENLAADPLFLPELLRRRAGEKVNVLVMRDGQQERFVVELRAQRWSEEPTARTGDDQPVSAPALGIAYGVLNEIADVVPGSAADKAGLKRGQKIDKVQIVPPKRASSGDEEEELNFTKLDVPLGPEKRHWPFVFFGAMQNAPPGTTVKVYVDGQKEAGAELTPEPRTDWFRSERGVLLKPITRVRVAASLGDALRLGLRETGEAMTMVVTFLQRIPDLWRHAAGPVGIVQIAGASVEQGLTTFLLVLTLISANLAVVNILPIPVLDGGHLMFLAYEGIRRKPPSEKVFIGLNFLGLALILGVMVLVLTLDLGRLFGG